MNSFPTLREKNDIVFFLCDVQSKSVPVFIKNPEQLIRNCKVLVECAAILGIPVIVGEHLPEVFGHTDNEILKSLENTEHYTYAKNTWSMVTFEILEKMSLLNKTSVILFGVEAHLCILNTALDLLKNGINCFIVEDAIRSERDSDMEIALKRFDKVGVIPVSVESCIYEIVQKSGEEFDKCRKILNNLKEIPVVEF
jgi:nicotinamidase-related amidase